MSALDDLKTRIDSAIYTNTEQNITGDGLQTVLDDMVDTMGVSVSQNSQTKHDEIKGGSSVLGILPSLDEVNDIKKIPFAVGKVRFAVVGQTLYSPTYQTNKLGTDIISCKEGDIFMFTTFGADTFRAWATIDSDNIVKRVASSYSRGGYVTIESGEVGIIFNKDTAELPNGYAARIIGEISIPELNDKINQNTAGISTLNTKVDNEVDNLTESVDNILKFEWLPTGRVAIVGQEIYAPSYNASIVGTDIIPCKQGDIFKLTIAGGDTYRGWATIDADGIVKRVADSYIHGELTPIYVTIESGEVGFVANKLVAGNPDGYVVRTNGETTIPMLNEKVEIDYNSSNMAYANLSLFVDDDNNIGMISEGVKVPYHIRTFIDLLPHPNIMSDDTKHQAFPCLSLIDNTLYMSWRKANAHVSINGGDVYRYSKDYGKTWSDETSILTYKNIEGNNYEVIHLERLIDIGNDKVFCLYGRYIATYNSGGDMDIANMDTYRIGGYVFNKTDIFDIDNAVDKGFYSISGLPDCVNVFGAPLYLNGIIYQTVYAWDSSDEYYEPSSYLIKSIDGGNTFVLVGKIADGGDETCIALAGNDKMIAVCRHTGTQGQDLDDSFFCVSKDMGATWEVAKQFPHFWHGHTLQKVGDKYLLMGRRGTYGRVSIALIDEYGDYAMKPYDFGGYGESGYSSIICSYDYLHFASYTRDENTMSYPNVFYFKMRKEDVIKETIK